VISSPSVLDAIENESIEIFCETADATMKEVVKQLTELKLSNRAVRLIDRDKEDSTEKIRNEGYF
jgi:hypothetical protein